MADDSNQVNFDEETKHRRKRVQRSFPSVPFEDALTIPNAIQEYASGQRIRRITLFQHLNKSPDSGSSRQLVTNSNRYGLTTGSYTAEYLELTQDGHIATSNDVDKKEQVKARFKLAVESIEPFKLLYEQYKNIKLPTKQVMMDFLIEHGYKLDEVSECVDIYLANSNYLGTLQLIAGAERLTPIEKVLEELPQVAIENSGMNVSGRRDQSRGTNLGKKTGVTPYDNVCFYIAPIGDEGSEFRLHSDLFLNHIVEPSVQEFGLEVIRADKISDPGIITSQIIEYIMRAKLVIADLSFHNPNVFYELSLRHTCRLPTVQIIRKSDKIPFDLDQVRTIRIDTTSIYTLVPQLELYRSEITEQVRRALEDPDSVDNPITAYSKTFSVTL